MTLVLLRQDLSSDEVSKSFPSLDGGYLLRESKMSYSGIKNYNPVIADRDNFIDKNVAEVAKCLGLTAREVRDRMSNYWSLKPRRCIAFISTVVPVSIIPRKGINISWEDIDITAEYQDLEDVITVNTLQMLTSSTKWSQGLANDGFRVLREFTTIVPKERMRMIVGDSSIKAENLNITKITIEEEGGRSGSKRTYLIYPLVTIFDIQDLSVTISEGRIHFDFSSAKKHPVRKQREGMAGSNTPIQSMSFALSKDSPNLPQLIELIKMVKSQIEIDSACLEVCIKNIDKVIGSNE